MAISGDLRGTNPGCAFTPAVLVGLGRHARQLSKEGCSPLETSPVRSGLRQVMKPWKNRRGICSIPRGQEGRATYMMHPAMCNNTNMRRLRRASHLWALAPWAAIELSPWMPAKWRPDCQACQRLPGVKLRVCPSLVLARRPLPRRPRGRPEVNVVDSRCTQSRPPSAGSSGTESGREAAEASHTRAPAQ